MGLNIQAREVGEGNVIYRGDMIKGCGKMAKTPHSISNAFFLGGMDVKIFAWHNDKVKKKKMG